MKNNDAEILKEMGHTVTNRNDDLVRNAIAETQKENVQKKTERVQQPVEQPVAVKAKKFSGDNMIFRQLRQTFGIDTIQNYDFVLNEVTFTLKPLTAKWVSWADSLALQHSIKGDGTYSIPEYQTLLEIFLAGTCVEEIGGQPLTEVFENADPRLAKARFIDFLQDQSKDELYKRIWEAYNEHIEPKAKVLGQTGLGDNSTFAAYKCTQCGNIESYAKRDANYFCFKDGAKLEKMEVEDLPLQAKP